MCKFGGIYMQTRHSYASGVSNLVFVVAAKPAMTGSSFTGSNAKSAGF
jgi:hypothetical protein